MCSHLPVLSSLASAPSSSLRTRRLAFGLCRSSERATDCCRSSRGPVGACLPGRRGDPFLREASRRPRQGRPFPLPASLGKGPGHTRACKGSLGFQAIPSWTSDVLTQPTTLCLGKAPKCLCPLPLAGGGHPRSVLGRAQQGCSFPRGCSCRAADLLSGLVGFVTVLVRFSMSY